jgi:UPF0716 family protein affecting phage T7 exclusion
MNKQSWGGIIIWGVFVTCIGLGVMNPAQAVTDSLSSAAADQEVIFLLVGGLVTSLIGVVGLIGFIGSRPRSERQSSAAARTSSPSRARPSVNIEQHSPLLS